MTNETVKKEAPQSGVAQVPQRRVGTVTMGLAMITAGVVLLCWLMEWIDLQMLVNVCRFAPLLLVGTGIELCIWGVAGEKVRLKYDFLSVIFCGLLLCLSLGMCTLAVLANNGVLERLF